MRRALGVTVVIAVLLSAVGTAQAADRERGALPPAEVALQRALAIFRPELAQPRYRAARAARPDPRAATMVLRDLVGSLSDLSPADRRLARSLLLRPTDTFGSTHYTVPKSNFRRNCPANFCVHWVVSGRDAPSLTDRAPKNGLPDWIDKVKNVMANVWSKEVTTYGYKKPRSDPPFGGHRGGNPNSKLDVFIADVGRNGIYGFCTTDDPTFNTSNKLSAYCVLDDDFAKTQFPPPSTNGLKALKVTAAHEFHHAIQFAYDFFEDRALMEGTATNMEASVYPTIHDNYQYFPDSPLSEDAPWVPIDIFRGNAGAQQYGSWIFYRFLSEYFTAGGVGPYPISTAPSTLYARQIWVQAQALGGTNGGKYSTQAIEAMIGAQGIGETYASMLQRFGAANVAPKTFYKDWAVFGTSAAADPGPYPVHVLDSDATASLEMLHLSNDYFWVGHGTGGNNLQVSANFPGSPVPGLGATVLTFDSMGVLQSTQEITLNGSGDGTSPVIPFGTGVKAVVVVTNGSTRFGSCETDGTLPTFSCSGVATDDFVDIGGPPFAFQLTFDVSP